MNDNECICLFENIEPHICPYKVDICDDFEDLCECCDHCIDHCAEDI